MDKATKKMLADMQQEASAEQAASDAANGILPSDEIEQPEIVTPTDDKSTPSQPRPSTQPNRIKKSLNAYLFNMQTSGGKIVNYSILILIIATVFISMLNTLPDIHAQWGEIILASQMAVLYIFLIEYLLRVYAANDRKSYIFSFYGVIDFLTILPLLFGAPGSAIMRLFRLFRIMKVAQYFPLLTTLMRSVSGALNLIFAVLATITAVSVFAGNLAYMLEPETFPNAFIGAWWSLVTMSTVGYGDLVPHTPAGMALAGTLILVGICVVAMMTAVIAVRVGRMVNMSNSCLGCDKAVSSEYKFCPHCGQDQSDEIDLFTDDD